MLCLKSIHTTVLMQCTNLNNILNGEVTIDPPSRVQGATATYSCMVGFTMNGNPTRTCDSNGMWTGTEPTCERKFKVEHRLTITVTVTSIFYIAVDCGDPPTILTSTVNVGATTYQSQAIYMCQDGYEFSNGMPTFTRECLLNGEWSDLGNAPTCDRE